jgi:hypothetical protein
VAARQVLAALSSAKANADASAELAGKLTKTGAVNKLDQARREVFASEIEAPGACSGLTFKICWSKGSIGAASAKEKVGPAGSRACFVWLRPG